MRRTTWSALLSALMIGALACQGSPGALEEGADQLDEKGVGPGLVLAGDECTCATEPTTICGDVDNDGLIEGTNGPDVILGTVNDETIHGYEGDDLICGGGGNDLIISGGGNDRVRGNEGNDRLSMDGGNDTGEGGFGNDDVQGDGNYDRCFGGPGANILRPTCEVTDGPTSDPPCEGIC